MGIKVGDRVPVFSLPDQDGAMIDISQFTGRPMVIYFYPKDDTPGCTREACAFRDEYETFTGAGIEVFGISADTVASHASFRDRYRLPFSLLSDTDNAVRRLFGVPSGLFGLIPGRYTYVIDKDGKVKHVFNSQTNMQKHVTESLKALGIAV